MQIQFNIPQHAEMEIKVTSLRSNLYGINRSYLFIIQFLSRDQLQFKNELINATLIFSHQQYNQYHHGYIRQYEYFGKKNDWHHYKIYFDSILFPLKLIQSNKTYIDQKINQVIKTTIEHSLNDPHRIKFELTKTEKHNPIIIQYQQTNFDFFYMCIKRDSLFYQIRHAEKYSTIKMFDDLQKSDNGSQAYELQYIPKSKMMSDLMRVFDQEIRFNESGQTILLKTNNILLMPGMIVRLEQQLYRIIYIAHRFQREYFNRVIAIPALNNLPKKKYLFAPKCFVTQAQICSSNNYPEIDHNGDYFVKFYFDQNQQKSCPLKRIYPYNMHFGLRNQTEVAVGFMNDDLNQPIILGSFANTLSPNVVSSKNRTQNRIRSWGGSELLFDDATDESSIQLHTQSEKQSLMLSAKIQAPCVEMKNLDGQVNFYAKQDINISIGGDQKLLVRGHASIKVYDHYQLYAKKVFQYQSDQSIYFESGQDMYLQSEQDNVLITGHQNSTLSCKKYFKLKSHQSTTKLSSKNAVITFSGNKIQLTSGGKIFLNSSVNIQNNGVNLGHASLNAATINIQPIAGVNARIQKNGQDTNLIHHSISHHNKTIKVFPLIALNLRPNLGNRYFHSDEELLDPYKKIQLSSDEFSYFVHHGNNVTIFIHGYNVEYGEYGKKIQTDNQDEFERSIYRYQNIYRDQKILQEQFPDATVNNKPLDSSNNFVINDQLNPTDQLLQLIQQPLVNGECLLNGTGAHNWWLNMENNFNRATGQFDGIHYDRYERMLHIAWQGNPKCPLDYYADLSSANLAAKQLLPVVKKLIAAGVQVNFVAHSLGNYLLMEVLNQLPADSIDHVFMWQPAIPDYSFSKKRIHEDYYFPNAANAVKKIIILYSKHDNILGPCDHHDSHFIRKSREAGIEIALMIKALDLLDHLSIPRHLLSVYNVANTFGFPFSDFFQGHQFRSNYYQKWIVQHKHIDGKPFETTLENQIRFVRHHYLHSFNLISMAIAMSAYGIERVIKQYGRFINQYLSNSFHDSKNMNIWELIKSGRQTSIDDPICNEVAAIIITVYLSEEKSTSSAMGYSGVRPMDVKKIGEDKVILVDQSSWLYSHSGIRLPSAELMENVYKKIIWQSNKTYRFGQYQH